MKVKSNRVGKAISKWPIGVGTFSIVLSLTQMSAEEDDPIQGDETWTVNGNVTPVEDPDDFNGVSVQSQNFFLSSESHEEVQYFEVEVVYSEEEEEYSYDYQLAKTEDEDRAIRATPYAIDEEENVMLYRKPIASSNDIE